MSSTLVKINELDQTSLEETETKKSRTQGASITGDTKQAGTAKEKAIMKKKC